MLVSANLSNANLSGATLTSANLTNSTVHGTNLSSANLNGANLTQSVVRSANLAQADLTGATLTGVFGQPITGTPAHLPANWSIVQGSLVGPGANLINDELSGATLTGLDLAGAQLDGADLTGGDLSKANLSGASLIGTVLTKTSLDGTSLAGSTLTTVVSGGVTGTPAALPPHWVLRGGFLLGPGDDYSGDNLSGLGLAGVDLSGADLSRANLSGANLAKANLAHANLTSANLAGATLFRAVLTSTIWSAATCPNGAKSAKTTGCTKALAFKFGGFSAPKPGSTIRKSAHSFVARFKLTNAKGMKVSAAIGKSLANNKEVRATLSGPGITPVNTACKWNASSGNFQCTIKFCGKVKTGKSRQYTVVVSENYGKGFAAAPKRAGIATQVHIGFK